MSTEDMFARHIKQPEPEETLWHYMNFPKLISIIDGGCLFFSQLKMFDDQFEGIPYTITAGGEISKAFNTPEVLVSHNSWRSYMVASCWNVSEHEDNGMWSQYAKDFGVALKTNVQRLEDALSLPTLPGVRKGLLLYHKVEGEPGDGWGIEFDIFQDKRRIFTNENEYRIVLVRAKERHVIDKMGGLYVPVNLYRLVAQIVLSPKSPDWFLALMQSITRKAGLSAEVVHSDFDRKPFA